ncbi:hypothetical protein [Rhodopirellula sp. MGV]|uniref:hypothetical protein n=1 Tax=Rhodopirellula sp. MGV TaxID=2023130 RepID=UPI000B9721D9|nr:hypothetical protein [Rhodopirellula sp. MGV]OYP36809.1 hypothetical protein CGZ80_07115 [Rhodopirellula sp. MGV]PNY36483.1 hypothetical protein C2E31_12860 [Rhodopirellula baltica]
MTQLMLFDTDSLTTAVAPVSAASAPPAVAIVPAAQSGQPTQSEKRKAAMARNNGQNGNTNVAAATRSITSASQDAGDDNLHRMGDLARLVLLRYQLVAKRREEFLSRAAARRAEGTHLAQVS